MCERNAIIFFFRHKSQQKQHENEKKKHKNDADFMEKELILINKKPFD